MEEKPQTINLQYEFIWRNPRYVYQSVAKHKGTTWSKTQKNFRLCLKVNLVESTRKEYEITYDLSKYKKNASGWTVHCYPKQKEKVEDFWKRFEPVATAEYIRGRMNWINMAVNLAWLNQKPNGDKQNI